MLPSHKILYKRIKLQFPDVARQIKLQTSTVFRIKFGATMTDWALECRWDYMAERLRLVDKTLWPEWLSEDDKKAYEDFKQFALTWIYVYPQ